MGEFCLLVELHLEGPGRLVYGRKQGKKKQLLEFSCDFIINTQTHILALRPVQKQKILYRFSYFYISGVTKLTFTLIFEGINWAFFVLLKLLLL